MISPFGLAVSALPELSQTTPRKPITMPAHSARVGCCPRIAPNKPIHSGIDATATAARPDDTVCSATQTKPLPNSSSATAMKARFFHCARVGAA